MAKLSNIRNLAYAEAGSVSSSPQDWMRFMDTASRMYRYRFLEQLLIYAQRPEATACAALDTWNQKVGRWVNRGAKGIALIDDTAQPERLRYVFDIADTHAVRGAPDPYIWRLEDRHKDWFLAYLSSTYNLTDVSSIMLALEQVAEQVTDEYIEDAMYGIEQEMNGSLLATLDEGTRRDTLPKQPVEHQRPPKELWQKFYENGEYVRHASHEVGSEENYNHIDGVNNNRKPQRPVWVDPRKRPSVRKRLQEKLNQVHGAKEKQRTREKT